MFSEMSQIIGGLMCDSSFRLCKFTDRDESMVAMDFSGNSGRVIQNPHEIQNAEQEEGHNWRVSVIICINLIIV